MDDAEMSVEEEHHHEIPLNNKRDNIRDGEFWVELNDSQDNKSELKQNVQELRSEFIKVKEDNEIILKSQEELNVILLAKLHNDDVNNMNINEMSKH